MPFYLICYDMTKEHKNYKKLDEAIEQLGKVIVKSLDSVRLVASIKTIPEIMNALNPYFQFDGQLLVSTVGLIDGKGFSTSETDLINIICKSEK